MLEQEFVLGLDIGGTRLKLGLMNRQGEICDFRIQPLPRKADGKADIDVIIESVAALIEEYKGRLKIIAVGVSTPGILDIDQGIVLLALNLGWMRLPIRQTFAQKLNMPVFVLNDAVAGAVGELRYGNAYGKSGFLYVSIGTGIGASLYVEGRFYKAGSSSTINLGHNSIIPEGHLCGCGNRGCLEKYVSGPALSERVRQERKHVAFRLNEQLEHVESQDGQDARLLY
jgi:glucokinase